MGEPEVDQAVLDKTRKELSAIIKAPKLSDRLLKKPPFRFLHDIVTNVIKSTGFATMLYTDDELDSAKVTEKEAKIFFLQKIISSVNYTLKLDPPLQAKPVKIVSGLESDHTNVFLQELVRATKVPKEKSDKAVSKVVSKMQEKAKAAEAKEAKAKAEAAKAAEPAKGDAETEKKADAPAKEDKTAEEKPAPAPAAAPAPAPSSAPGSAGARPSTAQQPEEAKEKATVEPRTVARKQQKEEQAVEVVGVIKEGKKGDRKGDKKGGGLEKNTLDTDSEDENPHTGDDTPFAKAMAAEGGGGDGVQGHLMQEIEKKKEAMRKQQEEQEKEQKEDTSIQLKTTMRKPTKEREVFSTEVSKLRDSLQALVKTTNPLGKTFDYVQEDIDSMAKEYASWKRQAADTKAQAQETERASQDALQPLQAQLHELEDAISDQLNKIRTVKANILKNDTTIETLLRMVINAK
eukprot:Hpha_TRINITY_DN16083_c2_g2::TRINITY_DN16083_c2_g2_i1::g.117775::m.117775/K19680/TRAF3IP1, IFT54; TRAF3-interacting protein 1